MDWLLNAPLPSWPFQTLAELSAAASPEGPAPGLSAIPRWPSGGEAAPLSFAQERLWFLDQLMPDSPLYNVPLPLALEGVLDVAALAASLTALVARHEALRTTFAVVESSEPQTRLHERPSPRLPR